LEPFLSLGERHARLLARLRAMRGALDQVHEPRKRFGPVAFLRAVLVGANDDLALGREAASRELLQPRAHVVGQLRTPAETKSQLDRRRHLVDVLAPRPRGANEALLDVALVEGEI